MLYTVLYTSDTIATSAPVYYSATSATNTSATSDTIILLPVLLVLLLLPVILVIVLLPVIYTNS